MKLQRRVGPTNFQSNPVIDKYMDLDNGKKENSLLLTNIDSSFFRVRGRFGLKRSTQNGCCEGHGHKGTTGVNKTL